MILSCSTHQQIHSTGGVTLRYIVRFFLRTSKIHRCHNLLPLADIASEAPLSSEILLLLEASQTIQILRARHCYRAMAPPKVCGCDFIWAASRRFYTKVPGSQLARNSHHKSFLLRKKQPCNWSHFIDFYSPSVCGSSTGMTSTDTQVGTPRALVPLVTVRDVEKSGASTRVDASWVSDIEHVQVDDDPRQWSPKLKVSPMTLFVPLYDLPLWCRVLIHRPMTSAYSGCIGEYIVHGLLYIDDWWPR